MSANSHSAKGIQRRLGLALALALTALVMTFPGRSGAAVGYFHQLASDPSVSCATGHYANGAVSARHIAVHAPWVDSVGVLNRVSYQPMLWQSNGNSWVFVAQNPELHGGQGFGGLPDAPGFTINQPNRYYRASLFLRWYLPSGLLLHQEHVWAGSHQLFRVPSGGPRQVVSNLLPYCYMP